MDSLAAFILDSKFDELFVCLGNPKTQRFLLVPVCLDKGSLSEGSNLIARAGEFQVCGLFGYRAADRFADCRAEETPGAAAVMLKATPEFLIHLCGKTPPQRADAVDWLEKLHRLPDPREN